MPEGEVVQVAQVFHYGAAAADGNQRRRIWVQGKWQQQKPDETKVISRVAQKKLMVIQVSSAGFDSGNFASISIDNEKVALKPNSSGHARGLHIVVINPKTAKIEFAKVFDTFKGSTEFDSFIANDQGKIKPGSIIAAACKDDCARNLSDYGKAWFVNMGSMEILKLKYR